MIAADLAPLAVVLPFLGAAVTFILIRHARAQRAVSISTLSVTLLIEVVMLIAAPSSGTLLTDSCGPLTKRSRAAASSISSIGWDIRTFQSWP